MNTQDKLDLWLCVTTARAYIFNLNATLYTSIYFIILTQYLYITYNVHILYIYICMYTVHFILSWLVTGNLRLHPMYFNFCLWFVVSNFLCDFILEVISTSLMDHT